MASPDHTHARFWLVGQDKLLLLEMEQGKPDTVEAAWQAAERQGYNRAELILLETLRQEAVP